MNEPDNPAPAGGPADENTEVTLTILGSAFRITCPRDQEESMREAERRLAEKLDVLKKVAPKFSNEKLAILAALDIYHELINQELKTAAFESIVKTRLDEVRELLSGFSAAGSGPRNPRDADVAFGPEPMIKE